MSRRGDNSSTGSLGGNISDNTGHISVQKLVSCHDVSLRPCSDLRLDLDNLLSFHISFQIADPICSNTLSSIIGSWLPKLQIAVTGSKLDERNVQL